MHVNCSTCLELLSPSADLSSAPCGHVFHSTCILQWLETGKNNCPQCRTKCRENQLRRIYFTEGVDVPSDIDANYLQQQLDSMTFQLRCAKNEKEKLLESLNDTSAKNIGLKEEYRDLDIRFKEAQESMKYAKEQVKQFSKEKKKASDAQKRVNELEDQLKLYETIQVSVKESFPVMKERLHHMNDYSENTKQLIQISEELKKELVNKSNEVKKLHRELQHKTNECASVKHQLENSSKNANEFSIANRKLRNDLELLEEHNEKLRADLDKMDHYVVQSSSNSSSNSQPIVKSPFKLYKSPPTPKGTTKECGIVGIKRRSPLKRTLSSQENLPKSLFSKSVVNSVSSSQPSTSFYNGLGGHSKPEATPDFQLSKRPKLQMHQHQKAKKTANNKKLQTLNKYFTLDTP